MNGTELREWRKHPARNWSQEELARRLGVSRQAVYSWERDEYKPAGRLLELALQALEREEVGDE